MRRGARYFVMREREVSIISETLESVPKSQSSIAMELMLQLILGRNRVFDEGELVVDPRHRVRDGPTLYRLMSGGYYGFKQREKIMFFNAFDVEAIDEGGTQEGTP